MRVLLIYANQIRDLTLAPPVGLSYVATATRAAGHEVEFLDLLLRRRPLRDVRRTLDAFRPEVVGISVRNMDNCVRQRPNAQLPGLSSLISAIRSNGNGRDGPSPPIVVGGPAVTVLGEAALNSLDADFAVLGEGEERFPALLSALQEGRDPDGVDGICSRKNGGVTSSAPDSLDRFGPSGMQGWIDWRRYEKRGNACWTIQSKRGCTMKCTYCAYPMIEGSRQRCRAAADVVDEIEEVMAAVGPRTFEFVDSTFNIPQSHALEVCEEIIRRKLRVNLSAMGINPLATSRVLFTVMKRAGFNSMMVTPEAACDTMLQSLNKGFGVDDVTRTATLARVSGIRSAWFFLLGGPGETRETVDETLAFIRNELHDPQFFCIITVGVRVFPGTAVARRAFAEGQLEPGADLAQPSFYFSPDVEERWVLERVNRLRTRQFNVVMAAEEGRSKVERLLQVAFARLGVPPPYWRFVPHMLNFPLLRIMRKRERPLQPAS
jgi:radical SAM superfamily enzyme YgiQ (UPF0313 family)